MEKFSKKLVLYVLIPLFVIAIVVYLVDGNKTDIYGNPINKDDNKKESLVSLNIGEKVYKNAESYLTKNTVYKDGGKTEEEIDCSGLIIACYKKALEDEEYTLPFTDVSSQILYSSYIDKTELPKMGDLIFMSYREDKTVNHVGIVEKIEGDTVYFIDATNENKKAINKRSYKTDDEKIIGYGVMKLIKK